MSQSESWWASPLALDPNKIALLPEGMADFAVFLICNIVFSSIDIGLNDFYVLAKIGIYP